MIGIERVNLNSELMAKNHTEWLIMSDHWVADPTSSPNPELYAMLATLEHAIKLECRETLDNETSSA